MHIGNIYAMLGAWLSARSRGDDMLLRIEDIDEPRVVPGAAELMMDDLHWLSLDWDGDPVFQSARHDLYREALHCLENLTIDDAYDSPFDERNNHTPAVGSAANNAIAGTTPLIYPASARAPTSAQPPHRRKATVSWCIPHVPPAYRQQSGYRPAAAGQRRPPFAAHRHARRHKPARNRPIR